MQRSGESEEIKRAVNRGCLLALASASITGLMLFVNGSFVWAFLSVLASQGHQWAMKPEISQFLLLAVPVGLCLAEWKLIDYVRQHLRQQHR